MKSNPRSCSNRVAPDGSGLLLAPAVEQPQAQISLEKKVWDLWQFGDKGAFAALFADDFVNVDAYGFSTERENVKGNRQSHQTRIPTVGI